MKQNNEEFSIKDLWNFLIPKLWMIVLVAIAGAVMTFAYTKSNNTVTYSVSTSLFVYSVSTSASGMENSNVTVSKQRVPLYMEIIKSNRDFHEAILKTMTQQEREEFGFSLEEEDIAKSLKRVASMIKTEVLTTEQSGELEMFSVHVSDSSEACALRVAEIIRDLAIDKTKVVVDGKEYPVNVIYKNIPVPSEMSCVDNPRFSGSTVKYNPILYAVIGAVAGAAMAVFALLFYSALDDRVRNRTTLEKNFEMPILGVIPDVAYEAAPKKDFYSKNMEEQQ